MGRVFMDALDDPFRAVDAELAPAPLGEACDVAILDFHAEATSEKQAFGHHVDGRASLVVGTHTHVPTADARILARRHRLHDRRRHDRRLRFGDRHGQGRAGAAVPDKTARRPHGAGDRARRRLCAVAVETGADGLAAKIAPVRIGGRLAPAEPDFW